VKQITSISLKQYKTTDLESIQYRFIKTKENFFVGWEQVEIENMTVRIASAEKALVDLIHFRTGKYVVDLVIEKLQTYKEDLNIEKLIPYASLASQKTVKVFGLLFDLLGWNSNKLLMLVENNRSTHWITANDKPSTRNGAFTIMNTLIITRCIRKNNCAVSSTIRNSKPQIPQISATNCRKRLHVGSRSAIAQPLSSK
jgi:hypothetical protein